MKARLSGLRSLALGLVLASLVAGCGGRRHQTSTTTNTTTSTTAPEVSKATCPLTDLPPSTGSVPQRPALAVKVDNLPAARPPSGLSTSDVVYEQPVEGGITRFIAIFQCRDAPRIEPVRSARLIDPDLVRQYGAHPLFAYAGAVPPVVAKVDASSLIDVGVNRAPGAYFRDPARQAPHNLVSSTTALYAAGSAQHAAPTPPAPVFQFGPLPEHRQAAAVHIAFPSSNLTWTWQSQGAKWLRSYSGTGPALLAGGGQIVATNVVVMRFTISQGQLVLTGSGPAQVFRNGAVIDGSWRRPSLSDLTELVDTAGQVIPLASGQTWIELVPPTVNVAVTP